MLTGPPPDIQHHVCKGTTWSYHSVPQLQAHNMPVLTDYLKQCLQQYSTLKCEKASLLEGPQARAAGAVQRHVGLVKQPAKPAVPLLPVRLLLGVVAVVSCTSLCLLTRILLPPLPMLLCLLDCTCLAMLLLCRLSCTCLAMLLLCLLGCTCLAMRPLFDSRCRCSLCASSAEGAAPALFAFFTAALYTFSAVVTSLWRAACAAAAADGLGLPISLSKGLPFFGCLRKPFSSTLVRLVCARLNLGSAVTGVPACRSSSTAAAALRRIATESSGEGVFVES